MRDTSSVSSGLSDFTRRDFGFYKQKAKISARRRKNPLWFETLLAPWNKLHSFSFEFDGIVVPFWHLRLIFCLPQVNYC